MLSGIFLSILNSGVKMLDFYKDYFNLYSVTIFNIVKRVKDNTFELVDKF